MTTIKIYPPIVHTIDVTCYDDTKNGILRELCWTEQEDGSEKRWERTHQYHHQV